MTLLFLFQIIFCSFFMHSVFPVTLSLFVLFFLLFCFCVILFFFLLCFFYYSVFPFVLSFLLLCLYVTLSLLLFCLYVILSFLCYSVSFHVFVALLLPYYPLHFGFIFTLSSVYFLIFLLEYLSI